MNIEDDEEPDADYGVFGDAGKERPPRPLPSPEEQRRIDAMVRRREAQDRVSRDFNSHMIHLFNRGCK